MGDVISFLMVASFIAAIIIWMLLLAGPDDYEPGADEHDDLL